MPKVMRKTDESSIRKWIAILKYLKPVVADERASSLAEDFQSIPEIRHVFESMLTNRIVRFHQKNYNWRSGIVVSIHGPTATLKLKPRYTWKSELFVIFQKRYYFLSRQWLRRRKGTWNHSWQWNVRDVVYQTEVYSSRSSSTQST